MTPLYAAALLLGVVLLIVDLWSRKGGGEDPGPVTGKPWGSDFALPGTRAERSDDYALEGGVGGAEGEGISPGQPVTGGGGIGGAEGGDDLAERPRARAPASSLLPFVARALIFFGAMGLALAAVWPKGPRIAVLGLALLIGAGESALTWLGRRRAAGAGPGRP
jgi:hypothetical protein